MKRVFVLLVACASLLACESLALGQELQVGSPLRKSIAPGETHHYSVSAQVDQRIHVSVEQRGIDVVVRLFAPDGKKVAEIDGPTALSQRLAAELMPEPSCRLCELRARSP